MEDVPDSRELAEPLDLKEPPDLMDPQDLKEFKDLKDQLVLLDLLDRPESREIRVVKDLLDVLVIQLSGLTPQLLLPLETAELNGSLLNHSLFLPDPLETDKLSDTRPGQEVLLVQAPTTGDSELSILTSKLSLGQQTTSLELNTLLKEFYSNKDLMFKDSPFNHVAQFPCTLHLVFKTLELSLCIMRFNSPQVQAGTETIWKLSTFITPLENNSSNFV